MSKGLGWDDQIPESTQQQWSAWLSDLPKLERFEIPRCFKLSDFASVQCRELHHFSDASSQGYGTVSYLCQVDTTGKVHCSLVTVKSRLAPLKSVTIPRMELSAAVLATRLDRMIKQEITTPIDRSVFWTDSTCVLRYIENKDKQFQTFVANRISAILEQSTANQWGYVDTSLNPADEASRGMTALRCTVRFWSLRCSFTTCTGYASASFQSLLLEFLYPPYFKASFNSFHYICTPLIRLNCPRNICSLTNNHQ